MGLLAIVCILAAAVQPALAVWYKAPSSLITVNAPIDNSDGNLGRLVLTRHLENHAQALTILKSMESAPSCSRLAVTAFWNQCQTTQKSPHGKQTAIDDTKNAFAASLAICELQAAKIPGPRSCNMIASILSSPRTSGGQSPLEIPHLDRCLNSLHSDPMLWTSYSNNRQNAQVLCEAARAENHKDELIKLHESLLKVQTDNLVELDDHLAERKVMMDQVKTWQIEVLQAQEAMRQAGDEALDVVGMLASVLRDSQSDVLSFMAEVRSNAGVMDEALSKVHHHVDETTSGIARIFRTVIEGGAELAAAQYRDLEANHDLSLEAYELLRNVVMQIMDIHDNMSAHAEHQEAIFEQIQSQAQKIEAQTQSVATQLDSLTSSIRLISGISRTVGRWISAWLSVCTYIGLAVIYFGFSYLVKWRPRQIMPPCDTSSMMYLQSRSPTPSALLATGQNSYPSHRTLVSSIRNKSDQFVLHHYWPEEEDFRTTPPQY